MPGGPGRRVTEQNSVRQRFVVCEQVELSPLQKETEVTNSTVSSQELSVEGGILGLGGVLFLGEERLQRPGTLDLLLEDGADVGI